MNTLVESRKRRLTLKREETSRDLSMTRTRMFEISTPPWMARCRDGLMPWCHDDKRMSLSPHCNSLRILLQCGLARSGAHSRQGLDVLASALTGVATERVRAT